ncbi:hypothetical protein Micbo1qcDRAFT_210359 [Microdochium bolleyi]|uniref:Uncharacterized protein n=1 Tax=Microdochium bolleyi TaxID=196109 RepID=A0A136IIW5_9PEZI|nr:hypothetical protein Micbo1qcDRAFT_210359 [Microdochium bolleyi]
MNLAPTWTPTASFRDVFDMRPHAAQLDESPWGDAYEMFKFEDFKGSANYGMNLGVLAKLTGADQLVTIEIGGLEEMPKPGVTVWCVKCFAKGDIKVTGSATFSAAGLRSIKLGFDGSIEAQLQLGINAYMEYEKPILKFRLLAIPLLGYSVHDVTDIGVVATLDFDANVKVEALGQMLAGIDMQWIKIGTEIDLLQWAESKAYGVAPYVAPAFDVSGEATVTSSLGLPIALAVGVIIPVPKWDATIAVVDRPAIQGVAEYRASYVDFGAGTAVGSSGLEGCKGIHYYASLINEFQLQILGKYKYDLGSWKGPKFREGCIGDNGVSQVIDQQSPPPAGKSRLGCDLPNNAFNDGEFATGSFGAWKNWRSDDRASFNIVNDDKATSGPKVMSIRKPPKDTSGWTCQCSRPLFTCACPEDKQEWNFELSQDMNVCTWSKFDFNVYGRVLDSDGACKIETLFLRGITDDSINDEYTVDKLIMPVTANNAAMFPLEKPIGVTVPSYDNMPMLRFNVGIKIKCVSATRFDIRLDNMQLKADFAASSAMRRDLLEDRGTAGANITRRQTIPTIPQGNNIPILLVPRPTF